MGACCGINSKSKQLPNTNLLAQQLSILKLMYEDLASRSIGNNCITRQVFDTFFHLNGLWGQQMFSHFDKNKEGSINFDQFSSSIDLMVKGGFDEKCYILFKFYDVQNTNGISYNELVRMLSSYSKQDLKQMLTDQNFLKTIDNYQLMYYFGPQKQFEDKTIIQQDQQQLQNQKQMKRIGSEYMPTSSEYLQIQDKLKKQFQNIKKQKQMKKIAIGQSYHSKMGNTLTVRNGKQNKSKINRKIGSMADIKTFNRSKVKLTSNITSLVKKYAVYLFKQLNLDKNKDDIKLQQFKQIISHQQKIFNIYFQGFHSYIWLHDKNLNGQVIPHYSMITPWIQGETLSIKYTDNNKQLPEQHKYYLKFIRTTLFVFKSKDKKPLQIKNMQGLLVEQIVNQKKISKKQQQYAYGLVIKHRDGIYVQKQYYFKTKAQQRQWLRLLDQFKSNSIYNQFKIQQKIGQGNFSSVYRGYPNNKIQLNKMPENGYLVRSNSVNQHHINVKNVAIKVIEKFKLSPNENQVIKLQYRILKLCYHPGIVKYIKQYQTKTRLYLITEYMSQGDLFQYTKKNTFLEQYEAAIVMKQLIQAIQYLHGIDLIHRDLKPQNVMIITKQGSNNNVSSPKTHNMINRVKIIDFGFAVYKSNLKNLEKKKKYAGSPGYMAPQMFKAQQYDEKVDMFSLGIIMFFLLSGNLPFHSPIYEIIVEQTVQCNISLCSAHWMNVSEQAKDLLNNLLTFKENRFDAKKALKHPWFSDFQKLKKYMGRNKKNRYI